MSHVDPQRILVTGGSGFIGSALVKHLRLRVCAAIYNVDKQTYAAAPGTLREVESDPLYAHSAVDIGDREAMAAILARFEPDAVVNLAAESHVDRSIDAPAPFIQTNVTGVGCLLDAVREYWVGLAGPRRDAFRFLHVSTDEVYGQLGPHGAFNEQSPYAPRSPYAASKAGGDHLVRAWGETYGLPVLISIASNNYGPYQLPEKLIPLMATRCLTRSSLPLYGDGQHIRDWLHVDDHVRALECVLRRGVLGQTYNVGARCERTNLSVVQEICDCVDELAPAADAPTHKRITFVEDRPGHDRRYAIDPTKIESELGWRPQVAFKEGLAQTVRWYRDNPWWWAPILQSDSAGRRRGLGARTDAGGRGPAG